MDNNKLSDDIERDSIAVRKFPRIDPSRPMDFLDRWDFYEYYDMSAPAAWNLSGREVCNALVHSFVFWTGPRNESSNTFDVVVFNSDRNKDEALFEMDLDRYMQFTADVICDEIETMKIDRLSGKVTKPRRRGPLIFDVPKALSQ